MKSHINSILNKILGNFGYEIKSTTLLPKRNLLGLKNRFRVKTIIDVGANLGQFASWARAEFPNATIHSFEPVKSTFDQLKKNTDSDPLWQAYNLAASSETCIRKINFHMDHSSSSSLLESTPTELALFPETQRKVLQDVNCISLDQWVQDYRPVMDDDILLKMDVQGYEGKVIAGATKLLRSTQAVIAEVIIEDLYFSQTKFTEITAKLESCDLNFVGIIEHGFSSTGQVVSIDAVFMRNSASARKYSN